MSLDATLSRVHTVIKKGDTAIIKSAGGIRRCHEAENTQRLHSSLYLASADPTTRTQDAGLQEPRISPTISVNPCNRLQHLQRPTPSDIRSNPPTLSRRGDGHVAGGGHSRLTKSGRGLLALCDRQRDNARPTAAGKHRPRHDLFKTPTERPKRYVAGRSGAPT